MLDQVKKLAGQTIIYGIPSILGRFLNWLLVPLYTYMLVPSEYAVVTELYSYSAFIMVFFTLGMETAYFRFCKTDDEKKVFNTTFLPVFFFVIFISISLTFFSKNIAEVIHYPDKNHYIYSIVWIIAFDAMAAIPFARLRQLNKPLKFAIVRFLNIGIYIILNLILILLFPWLAKATDWKILNVFLNKDLYVTFILISNFVASALTIVFLYPEITGINLKINKEFLQKILKYALPLILVGLAGIINEVLDRILLKYILHEPENMQQLGIYGAVYKLSLLMTLFIQAFRYSAEPFFFKQAQQSDSTKIYSIVMRYFFLFGLIIFLGIMFYMDILQYFIGRDYRTGIKIVPILIFANLCLGVNYNLSIWYKLKDKTNLGAMVSMIGAGITILMNICLIPFLGYVGAAWATFICYFSMMIISYKLGQKHFPIDYKLPRLFVYFLLTLALYFISFIYSGISLWIKLFLNTILLFCFIAFVAKMEKLVTIIIKKNER